MFCSQSSLRHHNYPDDHLSSAVLFLSLIYQNTQVKSQVSCHLLIRSFALKLMIGLVSVLKSLSTLGEVP